MVCEGLIGRDDEESCLFLSCVVLDFFCCSTDGAVGKKSANPFEDRDMLGSDYHNDPELRIISSNHEPTSVVLGFSLQGALMRSVCVVAADVVGLMVL